MANLEVFEAGLTRLDRLVWGTDETVRIELREFLRDLEHRRKHLENAIRAEIDAISLPLRSSPAPWLLIPLILGAIIGAGYAVYEGTIGTIKSEIDRVMGIAREYIEGDLMDLANTKLARSFANELSPRMADEIAKRADEFVGTAEEAERI